jgi:hypothetical protein
VAIRRLASEPPMMRQYLPLISIFSVAAAEAQQLPAPPELPNPRTGANAGLAEFFSSRTPYEFWLTCIIIAFGLITILLLLWHLRRIADRHADDVSRAVVIVMVIVGTLILVTAGYSNDQIAPAFGLFGTIVGYILGRLPRRDYPSSDAPNGSTSSGKRSDPSSEASAR